MLITSLLLASAYGQFANGNSLLEACRNLNNGNPSDYCAAYISGAVDTFSTVAMAAERPMTFCLEERMNVRQLRDVVVLYLERNPAIRHYGASVMVHLALTEAFPCKK